MPTRRLLLLFAGACALFTSACDFAGNTTGATGSWVGVAEFQVDTILAAYNVRIVADYQTTFSFDLTDDQGLITGQISAASAGSRTVTEAGYAPETITFDELPAQVNQVFGTYIDPELEVDVPDGPYEANLWTFDVTGRRARLNRFVTHNHQIALADGSSFTFTMRSKDEFDMSRVAESASAE